MGRASEWREQNDRELDVAEAADRLREAREAMEELLDKPQVYVLEGTLTKDEPLGWQSHYRLSGRWIHYWLRDTLPELRSGRRVRITIEEID